MRAFLLLLSLQVHPEDNLAAKNGDVSSLNTLSETRILDLQPR